MGTVSRAISCALAASSFLALAAIPAGVLPDGGRKTSVPAVVAVALTNDAAVAPDSPRNI